MLNDLPPTIVRFIEASNARDLDASVACFADDALVEDEFEGEAIEPLRIHP
jgi:hypothetical protein